MTQVGPQLVSVVIPTYRRLEALLRCIDSVYRSAYRPLEVIVVDDCSPVDPTASVRARFPEVVVSRNERRSLLSATRNKGIALSRGELILFVDDDNVVGPSAISSLVEAMESGNASVVAPVICFYSRPKTIWYAGSWMSPVTGVAVFPHRGQSVGGMGRPFFTSLFHDVFMVRRDAFEKVGRFDERNFPIYLSEADFSERMRRARLFAMVVPSAVVLHDVPPIEGTKGLLRNVHITADFRAYYVARNRILFMKKYRNAWQKAVFFAATLPMIAILHQMAILSSNSPRKAFLVRHYLGGVLDGLRMK